jgi:hypothetical protein
MHSTLVRRSAAALSAVSLALLATACSGSGSSGSGEKGEEGASEASAAKALTAAELEKRALTEGDVPKHQFKKAGPEDLVKAADAGSDKAECKILNEASGLISVGRPAATATVMATSLPAKATDVMNVTATGITLGSYAGQGAEEALHQVKKAAEACKGGFMTTTQGEETRVYGMEPAEVTGGDEAAAWTVTADMDGEKAQTKLVLVRKGNTLVTLHAINFAGKTALPAELIAAQLKKLG